MSVKSKKANGKANGKSNGKGKKVVKAKSGPRHDFVETVLPFIAKEFKAIKAPNSPKDRPRGFATQLYGKLSAKFGVTKNTADQYYWKAVWNHPKELGIRAARA